MYLFNGSGEGCVHLHDVKRAVIKKCQFRNNTSMVKSNGNGGAGGAVKVYGPRKAMKIRFTNCLFVKNIASRYGGALFVGKLTPGSKIYVEHSIFVDNKASKSGQAIMIHN